MNRLAAQLLPTAFGQKIAQWTGRENLAAPVVIGATGGSGTRAVQRVLAEAGLYMGLADDLNHAGDAMIFEPFLDQHINDILKQTHGLDYRFDALTADMQKSLEGEFTSVLRRHLSTRPPKVVNWGWKNPRSMYLLPLIQHLFPAVKFIHVVRDGRDMAVSSNQNQYKKHYAAAFGEPLPGDGDAIASFRLWCKVNGEVATFGREVLGPQYLRVRLEDFVEQPVDEISRMLSFIGLTDPDITHLATLAQRPESLGRWRRELAPHLAAEMQDSGGDLLDQFAYESGAAKT